MINENPYVLVVGYRSEIAKSLEKFQISYSIVSDKKIKKIPKHAEHVLVSGYAHHLIEKLDSLRIAPTHIIAGTESAVFPASRLRRHFGARTSEQALIRRCSNKAEMKKYLSDKGVPMTPFIISTGNESASKVIQELSLPIVVKSVSGSGGRNLEICRSENELEKKMGKNLIYERFVDAPEGSIESYVNHGQILFTNVTEYYVKGTSNIVPASYSKKELEQLLEFNATTLKKLKINWGLTHLEFYRHKNGTLFGEVALRPPGGYIMKLLKAAYDFNPWDAFVSVELDKDFTFPNSPVSFAACWVYHPGKGIVKSIKKDPHLPTLVSHKIKVKVGQKINERLSVGEDVGHSIFISKDVDSLKKDLNSKDLKTLISV